MLFRSEKNSARALRIKKVVTEPARYLNVLLFVRKGSELTATVLVAQALLNTYENHALALSIAIVVMLVLSYVVVGVGPRTFAKQNAARWIVPATFTARVLARLLGPVTTLLIAIGNAITPGKGFKKGPFAMKKSYAI